MTTFNDLVEETRHHLMTGQPDRMNVLDLSINDSVETVQLRYSLDGIDNGSRISIGQEIMFIISKSGNTPLSQATVIRGFAGSTKTAHNAGDQVRVNPQFTDFRIMQKINECINSLHGHALFQIKTLQFTYIPAKAAYEIVAPDFLEVWRVRYDTPGPDRSWPFLMKRDYTVDQKANTTDFPSGISLTLHSPAYPGRAVRVAYKAPFVPLVNLTDDVETVAKLPLSSHEIVPYGAAVRLLYGREIKRSFLNRQPDPRRQDEVPPGAAQRSMLPLVQAYYDTIDREVQILHKRYPEQTH